MESHKNTNTISTKHILSPTSDKCLRQITLKCRRFQTILIVTETTQLHHTVFHFRPSYLIITLYVMYYPSDAATHRTNRHPQKMYSHRTSRLKSPLLLTRFPFMTTYPQLVCLFKNLVNQVAINLGTRLMTLNSLCEIFG